MSSSVSDAVKTSYHGALVGWETRLLGFVQDNPTFPYYGCMDRGYWHYRAPSDFPSTMFQIGVLAMALGAVQARGTPRGARLHELTRAALLFWSKTQHSDGTHDEWYRHEHSYAATAFGAYAASEALLVLRDQHMQGGDEAPVVRAIERAAVWLANRRDQHVSNHTAGGIAALQNAAVLTERSDLSDAAVTELRLLSRRQHAEGWLPEYDGFDPGYLTVSIGYLAAYRRRGGDALADHVIERACSAATLGVNPDGSFGGPYGSRNTQFLMPHGLELIRDRIPAASWILESTLGTGYRQLVGPSTADDRYFTFFFLWSYLWAQAVHDRAADTASAALPSDLPQLVDAGLVRQSVGPWELAMNVRKGGSLMLFRRGSLASVEAGYAAALDEHAWATSQTLGAPLSSHIEDRDGTFTLRVSAAFATARPKNPLDRLALPFGFYKASVAHLGAAAYRVGDWIKFRQIRRRTSLPLVLERKVTLTDARARVCDVITNRGPAVNLALVETGSATTMHNPSSRFTTESVIDSVPMGPSWTGRLEQGVRVARRLELTAATDAVIDSGLNLLSSSTSAPPSDGLE